MGVLLTKFNIFHKPKPVRPAVTSYSWNKRQELGLSKEDFIIENATNDHEWKLPGSINGQQFVIQNCTDSDIYVCDFTNTVTIDDCTHCTIVVGPVKRSIFIRDCSNCKIIVACEQFRLRDCNDLEISLFCVTRPIIESCRNIKFSCFQLYYNQIHDHFQKSDLNVWNNMWYRVHDYTPMATNDDFNWSLSDQHLIQLRSKLPAPIMQLNVSTDGTNFVVPSTKGIIKLRQNNYENCLVVFCDDFSASSFLLSLRQINTCLELIKSRQAKITSRHAESLFLTSALVKAVQHSALIGLHMYGKNAIQICNQVISNTCETALFYVSPASNMASHQVNTFFSIADLQMETSHKTEHTLLEMESPVLDLIWLS